MDALYVAIIAIVFIAAEVGIKRLLRRHARQQQH